MNNQTPSTKNSVQGVMRLPDVCRATGLSKSTIWNKLNPDSKYRDDSFPKQFKISANAVAWSAEEIYAWLDAKQAEHQRQSAKPYENTTQTV